MDRIEWGVRFTRIALNRPLNMETVSASPGALAATPLIDLLAAAAESAVAPTAAVTPVAPPPGPWASFDPSLPPILVADDDADDTYFIQRLIKKTGVKNPVRTFEDGTEVVNFLGSIRRSNGSERHRPPLLLFLDLKMAGLGGFDFLEWARANQKDLAPLTIVVLSHTSDTEAMRHALELGAHRYLVKYPSARTFESIVRSVYPQVVF